MVLNYGLRMDDIIFVTPSRSSVELTLLLFTQIVDSIRSSLGTGMCYVQFQCRVTLILTTGRHFIRILSVRSFVRFFVLFRVGFIGIQK